MPDFDVIVLGTGAAALTAAVTAYEGGARVGLFEKSDKVGGTSAWSGGQIWIPNHPHMAKGRTDSREEALTYLAALSHDMIDEAMAEAFVDTGREMIDFLAARTPVTFYSIPDFPDYHTEFPGAKREGGRTLECPPFPFGELGDWTDRVTVSPYWPDYNITVGETTLGQPVPVPVDPAIKAHRIAHDERGMGQALIGRLLKACLDRGIEPRTGMRATELIMNDDAVTGVRFEDGSAVTAPAVVIATGGFEWDKALVRAFTRGPMTHPVSVPTNTGDGLKMAMRVGAMLGNMREAWWMPVMEVPTDLISAGQQLCTYERTMRGSIMVNQRGRRFTNEASNYNAFGAAFHEQDVSAFQYANLPAFMIFNQDYYSRFPFLGGMVDDWQQGNRPPQFVAAGATLRELAGKIGIDADGLETTVERFNGFAREGKDPDFHRGEAAGDIWWGDPAFRGDPRATLGPIEGGPYYAIEVKSGALGTKGGPQTDTRSRVLDVDGAVIAGLYCAGNAMASPMGMTYGGAGGTLGPAMVFGYLAGKDIGERVAALRQPSDRTERVEA